MVVGGGGEDHRMWGFLMMEHLANITTQIAMRGEESRLKFEEHLAIVCTQLFSD
jgi:hypothetical protein